MATPIDGFDQSTIQIALQANPDVRQRIEAMLRQNRDGRSAEQWLYEGTSGDARRGYVNPEFEGIITQALQQQGRIQAPQSPATPATPDLPQDQFNQLVEAANAGDRNAIAQLEAAGYEQSTDTTQLPIEQGLLQQALPSLLGDVEADAGRRDLAGQLTGDATEAYQNAIDSFSPEANAARLAEEYAQADKTGAAISESAGTAAADQLAALQESIASMQENLTGELATRAQALQDQIASLNANLDTLDASQKAALAEQIAANQRNLEQSITAQRTALTEQINSLRGGVDTEADARRTALTQQLESLRGVNTAQAAAQRAALEQQIASLGTAATTQAGAQQAALEQEIASLRNVNTTEGAARRAALQEQLATLNAAAGTKNQSQVAALQREIDGLTAAQAPMAKARLDSANALATAANIGLQSTQDALTAQRAKQGYLGSSSFDAGNMARAAIGARQEAAQALGGARELNAADIRTIEARAATEGRSLADQLALELAGITGQGAADSRSLADQLAANEAGIGTRGATGTRTIADTLSGRQAALAEQSAGGIRDIANSTAANEATIGAQGANQTAGIATDAAASQRAITEGGASDSRRLADLLAGGTQQIGDTSAAGIAGISGNTATGRFNVGNNGANQTFQDQIFGATQKRSLADALASGGAGIAGNRSVQQQAARDATAQARQSYFDNAYTRGLSGSLAVPGLTSSLVGNLSALDNYGQSGLGRALSNLNWWSAPGTAPVAQYQAVQADNSGNQLSALGTGVLGAAVGIGSSANWWAPKPAASPTGYTTPAGNIGVQTDWTKAF